MKESGDEDFVTDSSKKFPKLNRAPTTENKEKYKEISQSQNKTRARRQTSFQPEWLKKTDVNGDKVVDYLRQVDGEPYYVRCVVDSTKLRISTRGWAQIHDHVLTEGHKLVMTCKKSQISVGYFSEHHLADRKAVNNFHMRLLLFCNEHGVALDNFDCLVKCVKSCCPDSQIAKNAKTH